MFEMLEAFSFEKVLISSADSAYNNDDYCLLLLYWALTWDARADSGSTLVFASKEFLFDGSNWVLQSMDLKEKMERWVIQMHCTQLYTNRTLQMHIYRTSIRIYFLRNHCYLGKYTYKLFSRGLYKLWEPFLFKNPGTSINYKTTLSPGKTIEIRSIIMFNCNVLLPIIAGIFLKSYTISMIVVLPNKRSIMYK